MIRGPVFLKSFLRFHFREVQQKVPLTVYYYHATCEFQNESTLYSLSERQGTPCLKQAPYLKFKCCHLEGSM